MLLSLAFVTLSTLLTLPTTATRTPSLSALNVPDVTPAYYTVCYDHRYATRRPSISDCVAIIQQQIPTPKGSIRIRRIFSRHPTSQMLKVPHTWTTQLRECNITIDITGPPFGAQFETAMASMQNIKDTALGVLTSCVRDADHLGGFSATGEENNLLVRVEAGDESVVRAVRASQ
ncbi:MAG: hypothetical protein LQ348_003280 [Seirophora lacunosa]|nr:MAG: hypothetical protein LQ348_003280 [Seirophora lacunosa]